MKTTIGEVISRVRNLLKSVNQDSFLTDRFLYSVISKHASWLLKREDSRNQLMKFISIFDKLQLVDLIDVDKVEAGCAGIRSNCYIKRTKVKLPKFQEGYWGPLIRTVSSLDGSEQIYPTTPVMFTKISNSLNFKYNKTKYYWIINDHAYFPNLDWDGVAIEAVFDGDISAYSCCDDKQCVPRQDQNFNVPDYLHGELENNVLKDLGFMVQSYTDPLPDKQNNLRS
jgi:hypothetical protein